MVILMNDMPHDVTADEVKSLVEHYHPVRAVDTVVKRRKGVDWKVDLGQADREVANFVIDHLKGRFWKGHCVDAYCPLYQQA
jgi:hypothetical protein